MTGTNFEMNASTNIQSVAQKIIKNLGNISNQFEDLVDLLADFTTASAQAGGAMGNIGQSSKGAVTDVKKLKKALSEGGDAAKQIIKDLNFKDVNLSKLSAKEIENFGKALREAGSSLGDFLAGNITAFVRADKAVKGLAQELDGLAGVSKQSGSTPLLALADLTENREDAKRLLGTIEQLKQELKNIGPAAESGNQKAIQDYQRMTNELDDATRKAEGLKVALKETANIFESAVGGVNQSLTQGGFQPITLEDIFPSSEQRKVDEMQRKISAAVSENVRTGAVQKTLQFFSGSAKNANTTTQRLDRNIVQLTSHLPRMRYALYDVSNSLTIFGGGLLAVSAGAIKLSADFERSFADVIRTTGLAGKEVEKEAASLRRSLIDITKDSPVDFESVAEIATLAGQLNVATDSIGQFTETVAKFSATTDVTVDAAATAFGRLDQLVEGVDGQFEKLGSSILAVGVNAVATESDIIAISTQIASVANIAGFSASELVGFSSALASVGTRPELARGTFTRLFTEIQQSVAAGGDQLNAFARTAGQSVDQFTQAWGEGSGADQVIAILRGLNAEGKQADQTLAQLGITSVRDVPTLLKLAQSVEEVERQIRIANIGFIEGTELQDQYSIITSTLSEKVAVLKNNVVALGAAFGSASGPLTLVVDLLTGLVKAFESILNNPINSAIVGTATSFVGLVGVLGLFGAVIARAAGGFVGLGTALIEGFEAVGLMKVSMDQATVSQEANNLSTGRGAKVKGQQTVEVAKGTKVTNFNTFATAQNAKSKDTLTGATVRAATATRAFKFALGGLTASLGIGILLIAIDQLFNYYKSTEEASDSTDKFSKTLSEMSPFMEAVKKDTEKFGKATSDSAEKFQVFNAEVKNSNEELSERGRVLAAVSGEEDLYAEAADGSTIAIKNQTFAIGDNTRELIKQELALRLLADANKELFDIEKARNVQQRVSAANARVAARQAGIESGEVYSAYGTARAEDALMGSEISRFPEALQQQGVGALLEVIQDPRLVSGLAENGFRISEWADAVASGNTKAAESIQRKISPALGQLKQDLENNNPELFAEEIELIGFAMEASSDALDKYTNLGSDMIEMLKEAAYEQAIFGSVTEETAKDIKNAQKDTFDEIMEAAFGPINAQDKLNQSMQALGVTFQEEGGAIGATSKELQSVLSNLWETSDGGEDAAKTFAGFYNAIVEGGFATGSQLEVLQGIILETYKTFMSQQIAAAQQAVATQKLLSQFAEPPERERSKVRLAEATKELNELQGAFDGFSFDIAEKVNIDALTNGFNESADAANDTADAAEKIGENVEQSVRTLLDYAGDLESVFSRAFGLRFGGQSGIDEIAAAWESFTENVDEARNAVQELKDTQDDLAADVAIKEYFLSVAEAYDDQLRAAKLRTEIADIEKEQADAAKALADARVNSLLVRNWFDRPNGAGSR